MKNRIRILVAMLMLAIALTGCAKKAEESIFTARNEILTYEKIDAQKTQLLVSRTGNIDVRNFCEQFEALNPDIQVIYVDITGGNDAYKPFVDWIQCGCAPDIVITTGSLLSDDATIQYFQNLSANPVLHNYEAAALKRTATRDDVYWLPGPSDVTAMMYNKTLFQAYGWQVPSTFDEFVSLCLQIRADTNGEIEPWNPNAKYSNELQTALEAFVYEDVFGGVENRSWYNRFIRGEATFAGHMEPYFRAIRTLAENGILRAEHFNYSATARGKEFDAGKIAMINMSIYDADNDLYDFGYMPFPTTKGTLGYLSDRYNCFLGIPKKTHTEKENNAIHRFVAYFSSPEGQLAYIDKTMKVSNVKNVPLNQNDDLAALQPAIREGHMFAILDFISETGQSCNINLHQAAKDIVTGARTIQQCVEDVDRAAYASAPGSGQTEAEVLATAEKNMTILETSFYIADAYRETMQADIGLIAHGVALKGNLMRVFKGDLTPAFVTVLKPRSFANNSALLKVSMTGRQLLGALNAPCGDDETVMNAIYAYSGLACKVAPWNPLGEKYLSVKLAGGAQLQPDALYTVALWEGTVANEWITEVLDRYPGTFEDLITAKMCADKTVTPYNDQRIELVWD